MEYIDISERERHHPQRRDEFQLRDNSQLRDIGVNERYDCDDCDC
jgi:hypothetical protein